MAIQKKAVEQTIKNGTEIGKKVHDAAFRRGFQECAKWTLKQIGPIAGKLMHAKLKNGLPNKELRSVGGKLLNICKKLKNV